MLLRATPAPLNGAETKRAEFPRFYFVSDPTLLEILSLGSDPPSVVPHFQSGLFDSLTNVTFDKVDKTRMTEMFSQQAERVRAHNMEGFPGWFRIKARYSIAEDGICLRWLLAPCIMCPLARGLTHGQ
jgi:hypothetical protein